MTTQISAAFAIARWAETPFHDGQYRDGVAAAELRVASGTEGLANAAGTGKFRADPAGSVTLDLDGAW